MMMMMMMIFLKQASLTYCNKPQVPNKDKKMSQQSILVVLCLILFHLGWNVILKCQYLGVELLQVRR